MGEVGVGLEGAVGSANGLGIAEGRMLVGQDLPDRSASLGAQVVGLADAAAGSASERAYGRTESAGEYAGIECPGLGSVVRRTGGGLPGEDLSLRIVHQGLVVALVP
jgi:hypothetical protein